MMHVSKSISSGPLGLSNGHQFYAQNCIKHIEGHRLPNENNTLEICLGLYVARRLLVYLLALSPTLPELCKSPVFNGIHI